MTPEVTSIDTSNPTILIHKKYFFIHSDYLILLLERQSKCDTNLRKWFWGEQHCDDWSCRVRDHISHRHRNQLCSRWFLDYIRKLKEVQLFYFKRRINHMITMKEIGPHGTYPISVNVMEKGLAKMSSATTSFSFPLTTTSFNPTISGTGGKKSGKLNFEIWKNYNQNLNTRIEQIRRCADEHNRHWFL